jgi:hypothetical protein
MSVGSTSKNGVVAVIGSSFSFTPTFPLAPVNRPDPFPKAYITRGPMVRIRLPPAVSLLRSWLSGAVRKIVGQPLEDDGGSGQERLDAHVLYADHHDFGYTMSYSDSVSRKRQFPVRVPNLTDVVYALTMRP